MKQINVVTDFILLFWSFIYFWDFPPVKVSFSKTIPELLAMYFYIKGEPLMMFLHSLSKIVKKIKNFRATALKILPQTLIKKLLSVSPLTI